MHTEEMSVLINRQQVQERVFNAIDGHGEALRALSVYLYENPETALQEFKAATYITALLRAYGFEVTEGLGGLPTAFRGVISKGKGPKIAFIAEYDALPEIGHACGHHRISAMSVGAALGLIQALDTYEGEIAVIGTPAEETGDGKPALIHAGVFDGYDAVMMIHPGRHTCSQPILLAVDCLEFLFIGTASHAGGAPEAGINALDAVVLFYNNINALRQQLKDGTRISGIILEAGHCTNMIPDRGRLQVEIRAPEQNYFEQVVEKVKRCAEAAALATGTQLEMHSVGTMNQTLITNQKLAEVFRAHLADFELMDEPPVILGSGDMGNVSHLCPVLHPMLRLVENQSELHTRAFMEGTMLPFAEAQMRVGAKLLAATGLRMLSEPGLVERIHLAQK